MDAEPFDALCDAVAVVKASLSQIAAILPSLQVEKVDAVLAQYDILVRVGTVGVALAARRGVALEAHTVFSHRSAADWVATRSGVPHARAKDTLMLDKSLAKSEPVHEAFMRGELSPAEGRILANTVSVVPGCGPELLRVRRQGSLRELDQPATRVRQRAWSREHQKQRRARAIGAARSDSCSSPRVAYESRSI